MSVYAVSYSYVPEDDEMIAMRPLHVDFLGALYEQGRILASGRLTEGDPLGALIIITGDSIADVESTIGGDPFYANGFVAERQIRRWNLAFGVVGAPGTEGHGS